MGIPGGWELMLILAVLVLLFGASKLPNAARSIGQSMRIFKAETKGMRSEDKPADSAQHQGTQHQGTQNQGAPPAQQDGNQALPPAGPQVAPPLEHRQGHSDSAH
ncbi:MAG: Sec-independent protein translocase subunit TatA [Actinomycetota bacterium]|nr:Sec-independent protein translocase subunit TatA [Actinomycetota bacterium]